ncbi:MAG: sulfotransferase [Anaerolineales bacterium]
MNEASKRYLIIGGAPKSATTSLFHYLSDHPQVCPANRKETYFFAREFDYRGVSNSGESAPDFDQYFSHCPSSGSLRIEATPYTLYSDHAAEKISDMLPGACLLFILRDPVDRLISDYYFHVQRGHPSARDTFKEFLAFQRRMESGLPNLIELGCYLQYLRPFFDVFGRNRVLIIFFEEFKRDPRAEIRALCTSLGLDPGFYTNYDFTTHNKTLSIRNPWLNKTYIKLERYVARTRARLIHHPEVHRWFEKFLTFGKSAYQRLNSQGAQTNTAIDPAIQEQLVEYYRAYNQALSEELGHPLPWHSINPGR